MKYNFTGFQNWKPRSDDLDLFQSANVLRASLSSSLPRSMCEGCVCWRLYATCHKVQVEDWAGDAEMRDGDPEGYKRIESDSCVSWHNCCPILFFDFIGIKLPELQTPKQD